MSPKRAPSPPPEIAGFEYLSLIGSGGFSDVFLYQQRRPRRRVAVKVLLNEWSSESQRKAFDAEADLMATLSTHPSIVTMYEANVAADGRPYLAMEYCSRANLGSRYRSERFSVAEALRIAVQVAGAVETSHRAGILHRDIKPANILVTEYGHPALTDFGISSTMDDVSRAEGMSIPWSPPESFAEPPTSSIATDVWALGATMYTLLAGRSPFEVPGASNSSPNLVSRIQSSPLASTGRSDVPASLERVLATAMAKSPASRYPTVLAFARSLQQVQSDLSLAVTPIDLLDEVGKADDEQVDDDGTRLRRVVSIDPGGGRPQGGPPASAPRSGTSQPGSPVQQHSGPQGRPTGGPGQQTGSGFTGTAPTSQFGAGPGAPQPAGGVVYHGGAPAGAPPQQGSRPPQGAGRQNGVPPQMGAPVRPGARPGAPAPPGAPGHPPQQGAQRPGAPHAAPQRPGAGQARPQQTGGIRPPSGQGPGTPGWRAAPVDDTVHRPGPARPGPSGPPLQRPTDSGVKALWPIVAGAIVLLGIGVTAFALMSGDPSGGTGGREDHSSGPNDPIGGLVPSVTGLVGEYDTDYHRAWFSWDYSDVDGDVYGWKVLQTTTETNYSEITTPGVFADVDSGEEVCVEVVIMRDGKASASPQNDCVTAP